MAKIYLKKIKNGELNTCNRRSGKLQDACVLER